MSLATKSNIKKRPLPFPDRDQVFWHTPPQGTIADATTRPDLHEHHFNTQRGRRIYDTYRPDQERLIHDKGDICIWHDEEVDPHVTITEATPEGKHVHFTPRNDWYPESPMDLGGMPRPSLRQRMQNYGNLPEDYVPDSPFRFDTSGFIEEEERKEQRQRVGAQHTLFAKPRYTQHYIPAAASPSALGLSGYRKFQPAQSTFQPLRRSVLNKNTAQYQRLKSLTPTALDQTDSIPLSVADRPKLTPTRRLPSPPRQLTPPKLLSPEAFYTHQTSPPHASSPEAVYPSLSASYYDLSAETPHTLEAQQPEEARYIVGMAVVTTLANYLTGLITNCWNYLRGKPQHQQIVAVETDTTGRKRRAVAAEDATYKNTPSPQLGDVEIMPGQFPERSPADEPKTNTLHQHQNSTPPDSRPGSSESEDVRCETHRNGETWQQPSPPEPSRNRTEASQRARSVMLGRGWIPKEGRQAEIEYIPPSPAKATIQSLIYRRYKLPKDILSPEQRKEADDKVDDLITKAKKVALETEEEKTLRKSFRTRKQRLEDARLARERAEQAKRDAEREVEELRKQAEEEAKVKAAEEAAAKARKKQLIRPISEEWAGKIRGAMLDPKMIHQVAQTPGTATPLSRSDFMKLLPEKDAFGFELRPKSSDGPGKRKGAAPSGWLNDEIVNGWNECIVKSINYQAGYTKGPNTAPEVAAFNCGWLTSVKNKNNDLTAISSWARRMGIKGKTQDTKEYKILKTKKIFFPINSSAHWMLMIIDVQNREIQFLDSLGGRSAQYFQLARQWLEQELAEAYVPDEWTESKVVSQRQMNFDDCGIFTCMNALASAVGKDFQDFGVTRGMNDARCMMGAVLLNGGFTGEWEL